MGLVVLVNTAVTGCSAPRFAREAEQTAQWTQVHGDGYRPADQPEAIVDLLKKYAAQNGGQVMDSDVEHGDRPGGHVDVLFVAEAGKFEADDRECWRFSFRQPPGDAYVRKIDFALFDCPSGSSRS
ncbi:hypothetical protein ACIBSW_36440 [Actinoplanes sp. NPDC049668]|uniref:hypothetical protein n=1 Tax=unclassified Actinoplanes TaxID=2626549 RepID=UPI00339E5D7E